MSEKWYEEMPEQGVFCRGNDSEGVFYIVVTKEIINDAPKDELEKFRQVSAQEWWQFAPWQPMRTAPRNREIFVVKDKNGNVSQCYESEFGFEYDEITTDDETDFLGWLPLPKTGG